nr:hypothetical protein [Tanacetum cinerariifolium]
MSSDNAQSAVTYTSISSDSDGPSWGIPLMNADPMELDEHAPVYVPEPQHPEYHAPSDDDIQVEDDDDDPEEDPGEEHEPEDDDEDPEEIPMRSMSLRVLMRLNRSRRTRLLSHHHHLDTVERGYLPTYDQAQLGRRAAMIHRRDDILVEDIPPRRIFALTGPPPGCDVAKSLAAAAARAPRSQYDFVDTVEAGQGLIRSPGHDTRTIARAADIAEDASYLRAL